MPWQAPPPPRQPRALPQTWTRHQRNEAWLCPHCVARTSLSQVQAAAPSRPLHGRPAPSQPMAPGRSRAPAPRVTQALGPCHRAPAQHHPACLRGCGCAFHSRGWALPTAGRGPEKAMLPRETGCSFDLSCMCKQTPMHKLISGSLFQGTQQPPSSGCSLLSVSPQKAHQHLVPQSLPTHCSQSRILSPAFFIGQQVLYPLLSLHFPVSSPRKPTQTTLSGSPVPDPAAFPCLPECLELHMLVRLPLFFCKVWPTVGAPEISRDDRGCLGDSATSLPAHPH